MLGVNQVLYMLTVNQVLYMLTVNRVLYMLSVNQVLYSQYVRMCGAWVYVCACVRQNSLSGHDVALYTFIIILLSHWA